MNSYLFLFLLLFELFFVAGLTIYMIGLLYSSIMGAPFIPTSKKCSEAILEKANLKNGQVFLELGSGDGRIVRAAVKTYGVKGIGIDINMLLVLISRFYARRQGLTNIEFKRQNVLDTDFSGIDVVYLFLMPEIIAKILPRLNKELKPHTLVISHGFKITGWEHKLVDTIVNKPFSTFFYRIR